jgi:hypothetical protein
MTQARTNTLAVVYFICRHRCSKVHVTVQDIIESELVYFCAVLWQELCTQVDCGCC